MLIEAFDWHDLGDTDQAALQDLDSKLLNLLERCRQKNIKLNKDKLKFKLRELSYVGHLISAEGLKHDPANIEAILCMPPRSAQNHVKGELLAEICTWLI